MAAADTRPHGGLRDRRASIPIEARRISRRFGSKTALDDVSLEVQRGEIHALLGPNGAGKTTLIRVICGLLAPDAGSASVFGIDAYTSPAVARHLIGYVPSADRTFYQRLSGLENLAFFGRLYGMTRRSAVARARVLLGDFGLTDALRLPVGQYSQGMQRRLGIARALLTDPPLLLADEATHTLDPRAASEVRTLFADLAARGTAVLWTTQRVEEIRGFAHTVTILSDGRVRFDGGVPQLLTHALRRRYVLQLDVRSRASSELAVAGGAILTPVSEEDDEHLYLLSLPEGVLLGDALEALIANGVRILACHEEQPEIEEAFLALTERVE